MAAIEPLLLARGLGHREPALADERDRLGRRHGRRGGQARRTRRQSGRRRSRARARGRAAAASTARLVATSAGCWTSVSTSSSSGASKQSRRGRGPTPRCPRGRPPSPPEPPRRSPCPSRPRASPAPESRTRPWSSCATFPVRRPFDQSRAPREAGAHSRHQHELARREPPVGLRVGERERNRAGRGVAETVNVDDGSLFRDPELRRAWSMIRTFA